MDIMSAINKSVYIFTEFSMPYTSESMYVPNYPLFATQIKIHAYGIITCM